MTYNTVEEVYQFTKLAAGDFQPSDCQACIDRANAIVLAFAPHDATSDRSVRMEPIRKIAELYLAAAEVFAALANIYFLNSPPIRILSALNFQAGADSPTPTELLSALDRAGDQYREIGMGWLARVKPITTTIRAGS
ncbi:MAG TPA: hypothetical protein PKK06_05105 [Phycisphaerae bacterium]|nr:hypothetical protein [Phycisphaerae bacterium]